MGSSSRKYHERRYANHHTQWEAVYSGRGTWYFKNSVNGEYMGIEGRIAVNGTPVISISQPFAWDVVPTYADGLLTGYL